MTIAVYSDLQAAISDRLGRADMSAAAPVVAEFISVAESRINRRLRTRDMETRNTTFPINGEYVPLPADFLQVRNFYIDSTASRVQLRYLAPEMQTARNTSAGTGPPNFYSVVGKQFRFEPIPEATSSYTASLLYFAKLPALAATSPSNWLLTDHPDAYLYGALVEAAFRMKDPESGSYYKQQFEETIQAIQASSDKGRWSGPGLASVPG